MNNNTKLILGIIFVILGLISFISTMPHFIFDFVGGCMFGLGFAWLTTAIYQRIKSKPIRK